MVREEKGEGGDRGDLGEKKESQKGQRVIKPVITLACTQTRHQTEPPVTWAANMTCVVVPEGPHHSFLGPSPGLFSGLQLPVTLVSPTLFEKKVKMRRR